MANVSFESFRQAATQAAQAGNLDSTVKVSGDAARTVGHTTWQSTNREAMVAFREALRAKYGDGAARIALEALNADYKAGKPLTARTVLQATDTAQRAGQAMFASGLKMDGSQIVGVDGQKPRTLDGAIDALLEKRARLRGASLTDDQRHMLKAEVMNHLLRAMPDASPEDMFQEIAKGNLVNDACAFLQSLPDGSPGTPEDKLHVFFLQGGKSGGLPITLRDGIGAMRGLQPNGPITPATLWQASFGEALPASLANASPEELANAIARRNDEVIAAYKSTLPPITPNTGQRVAPGNIQDNALNRAERVVGFTALQEAARTGDGLATTGHVNGSGFAEMGARYQDGGNYGRLFAELPALTTAHGYGGAPLDIRFSDADGALHHIPVDRARIGSSARDLNTAAELTEGQGTPAQRAARQTIGAFKTRLETLCGPANTKQMASVAACMSQEAYFRMTGLEVAAGMNFPAGKGEYAITLAPGENGDVTVTHSTGNRSSSLTFTIHADGTVDDAVAVKVGGRNAEAAHADALQTQLAQRLGETLTADGPAAEKSIAVLHTLAGFENDTLAPTADLIRGAVAKLPPDQREALGALLATPETAELESLLAQHDRLLSGASGAVPVNVPENATPDVRADAERQVALQRALVQDGKQSAGILGRFGALHEATGKAAIESKAQWTGVRPEFQEALAEAGVFNPHEEVARHLPGIVGREQLTTFLRGNGPGVHELRAETSQAVSRSDLPASINRLAHSHDQGALDEMRSLRQLPVAERNTPEVRARQIGFVRPFLDTVRADLGFRAFCRDTLNANLSGIRGALETALANPDSVLGRQIRADMAANPANYANSNTPMMNALIALLPLAIASGVATDPANQGDTTLVPYLSNLQGMLNSPEIINSPEVHEILKDLLPDIDTFMAPLPTTDFSAAAPENVSGLLGEAIAAAGLDIGVGDVNPAQIDSISNAIRADLMKEIMEHGQVTPARAQEIARAAAKKLTDAYQMADAFSETRPADAAFLKRLVLTAPKAPPASLVAALPAIADRMPMDFLQNLASADPRQALSALEAFQSFANDDGYQLMLTAGNYTEFGADDQATFAQYMAGALAARLPDGGAGIAQTLISGETLQTVERFNVLSIYDASERSLASDAASSQQAERDFDLLRAGNDMLRSVRTVMATQVLGQSMSNVPAPITRVTPMDLPVDLAARLPPHHGFRSDILSRLGDVPRLSTEEGARRAQAETTVIDPEAMRAQTYPRVFAADIERGTIVSVDGVAAQGRSPQAALDLLARTVTRNSAITYDALPQSERNQVNYLASLCHQGFFAPILKHGLSTAHGSLFTSAIHTAVQSGDSFRAFALTQENDDIVLRGMVRDAVSGVQTDNQRIPVDGRESYYSGAITLRIPRSELDRVANQDWSAFDSRNPGDHRLIPSDFRMDIDVALFASSTRSGG